MRKSILYSTILFLLVSVLNCGCLDDVDELYTMQISYDVDIPAGLSTIQTHFFTVRNLPTRYTSFRDANNYQDEDIGQIIAGNATLTTQFEDVDLNFVQGVEIHLINPLDPSKRSEAFYLEFEEFGAKTDIRLIPSLPDLSTYIKNGNVNVEMQLNLRGFSPINMRMRMIMEFLVLGIE